MFEFIIISMLQIFTIVMLCFAIKYFTSRYDIINNFISKFKSSPASKGKFTEQYFEKIFIEYFPQYEIINTSKESNKGDFIIYKKNKQPILIDIKYRESNIPSSEIDKFTRDVLINDMHGILISMTSGICNKECIDMSIINKRVIIYLSNCQDMNILKYIIHLINIYNDILRYNDNDNNIIITQDNTDNIRHEYIALQKIY